MKFSHEEKIWFPKSKITKGQALKYYHFIANYFIKHCKNHLMVLQRYPEGINDVSFYQKQKADYFPDFIHHKTVTLKQGGKQTLVVINTKKSLLYLANQATIVFHSWLSTTKDPAKPDKIVFDLDPATQNLKHLRFIALCIKKELEHHGLTPFVMTTGSKGYHIVAPIKPTHDFKIVHNFAKHVALKVAEQNPTIAVATATKTKRKNKIFIDYLRNSYGQTSVAPYSLRALEKAPIATPILWSELATTHPQQFTIKNIAKRITQSGDAWYNFTRQRKTLKLPKK